MNRRTMLAATAVLGLGGPTGATAARQVQANLRGEVATLARENRYRLDHVDGRFSGPGWDLLTREGRKARFFLLGEEHGIAENPKLVAALYRELSTVGYDTLAIETSPLMGAELDRAAVRGVNGLRRLLQTPGSQAAFYSMREEAEMLADVRAATPPGQPAIWGLDYDIAADRLLIGRLKAVSKPAAAEAALAALEAASISAWAQHATTPDFQAMFNFSGDPALVRALQSAWPEAPADLAWMLEVEAETLEINRLFAARQRYASNQRRADLNRRNLLRHWRAAQSEGRSPRIMFKFGANHMMRGLSPTGVFDIGTLVSEMAAIEGGTAFHLLVLPGAGGAVAEFDPVSGGYKPGNPRSSHLPALDPVTGEVFGDAFTVFDLRPLRALLAGSRAAAADRDLMSLLAGFDAVAVLSGSTPSANL